MFPGSGKERERAFHPRHRSGATSCPPIQLSRDLPYVRPMHPLNASQEVTTTSFLPVGRIQPQLDRLELGTEYNRVNQN